MQELSKNFPTRFIAFIPNEYFWGSKKFFIGQYRASFDLVNNVSVAFLEGPNNNSYTFAVFSFKIPYKNDHILFLDYCYLKTSFNYLKSSSSTKLAIFLLFYSLSR